MYCFCFSKYFSIAPDAYRCVFAVVEFFVVEFGGAAVAAAPSSSEPGIDAIVVNHMDVVESGMIVSLCDGIVLM